MTDTVGKVIKCKAAVAWGFQKPMTIEEIEVDPPQEGEVRLKIISAGVCRTDDHAISRELPEEAFPMVLGHEGAGVVESVGPGVTRVEPGDSAIPLYTAHCGVCEVCKDPKRNWCLETRVLKVPPERILVPDECTRFSLNGKKIGQFAGTSTFSEYTVVKENAIVKIDPKAPLDKVCIVGCQVATGFGASVNTANVGPKDTVAIWGIGGVGLAAIVGAKYRGAKRIIAVDVNPEKEEIARKLGCTDFLNPTDHERPIQAVIHEMTNGGCDKTIECIGNPLTMKAAIESCKTRGSVCTIIGISDKEVSFNAASLMLGQELKGSLFGGYKGQEGIPKLISMVYDDTIPLDDFISEFVSLDRINEGFDKLRKGETIRTVVLM